MHAWAQYSLFFLAFEHCDLGGERIYWDVWAADLLIFIHNMCCSDLNKDEGGVEKEDYALSKILFCYICDPDICIRLFSGSNKHNSWHTSNYVESIHYFLLLCRADDQMATILIMSGFNVYSNDAASPSLWSFTILRSSLELAPPFFGMKRELWIGSRLPCFAWIPNPLSYDSSASSWNWILYLFCLFQKQ